jgi:hypothetical protein
MRTEPSDVAVADLPAMPDDVAAAMDQPGEPNATWANVGSPVANLCAQAEALCQRIAPRDLAGLPVYVVPQSALPADLGTADACDGYTTPSLDL